MDPTSICRKARRLAGRQAELCQAEPEVVAELARGARLGVRECQFQFRFRRWNCSSHSKAFGRILQQGQCGESTWGGCFFFSGIRGEGGLGGAAAGAPPLPPVCGYPVPTLPPSHAASPTAAPPPSPPPPGTQPRSCRADFPHPAPGPQTSGRRPSCSL